MVHSRRHFHESLCIFCGQNLHYLIQFCLRTIVLLLALQSASASHVDNQGRQLRSFYLSMHVDVLWLNGRHVNWETGEPDRPDAPERSKESHCSAFVAAACERLHYYILRPPEHGLILLANAQYDWLATDAAAQQGWQRITGNSPADIYGKAQELANGGTVVVVTVKNPDPHKPGHAALVMPFERSARELSEEGPEVIMAGIHNYLSVSMREGFKNHITTWPQEDILCYAMMHK